VAAGPVAGACGRHSLLAAEVLGVLATHRRAPRRGRGVLVRATGGGGAGSGDQGIGTRGLETQYLAENKQKK